MTRTERKGLEKPNLEELQQKLRIEIDPELLLLALTHRSFAYENGGIPTNERLEFLGDSILGQAVTVRLFRDNPDLDEGELAKRRASLVSSAALAEVARTIGLAGTSGWAVARRSPAGPRSRRSSPTRSRPSSARCTSTAAAMPPRRSS